MSPTLVIAWCERLLCCAWHLLAASLLRAVSLLSCCDVVLCSCCARRVPRRAVLCCLVRLLPCVDVLAAVQRDPDLITSVMCNRNLSIW
jgi:hypothetical protein